MNKIQVCLITVVSFILIGWLCAQRSVEGSAGSSSGVHFEESSINYINHIPKELCRDLNNELAYFTKAIADGVVVKSVKDAVLGLDSSQPLSKTECSKTISRAGTTSISVIAEVLLSNDEKARNCAILAIGCLQPISGTRVKEIPADQALRIMLLRVGILDRSPTVRRNAIRYLARIGYANLRDIPQQVYNGIETAKHDPDKQLRVIAETEYEALKLKAEHALTTSESEDTTPSTSYTFNNTGNE